MSRNGDIEATLVEFLRERAEKFGDRDALLFKPGFRYQRWSYNDIWNGSERIAALLQARGLSKGDRVIIWGPNCPQWVLCLFGCLRAGVIVVPLDVRSPREFVENVTSRVDAKLSFVSRATPSYHAELGVPEIDFEDLEALSEDLPSPAHVDIEPDDLAEVMFTSGTTGDPKGVMLTHRNITANISSVVQVAPGKESDRLMSILPLSHMLEQMGGLFVPMNAGANITYPIARQATVLFRTMQERRVTMMVLVPQLLDLFMKGIEREVRRQGKEALWARLLKVAASAPFPLRRVLFRRVHKTFGGRLAFIFAGGAPLPGDLGVKWNLLGINVIQGYGATETSPVITCHLQSKPRHDSPGPPVPGVEVKIASDGEVLVRGENVTPGYWNAPDATAAAFQDEWYKTGDQGEFDSDGNLHLKGRKKDMIVLGSGLNVYPEDIEAMLVRHDAVDDAAVVGLPGSTGPEVHAALLVRDIALASDAVSWANNRLAEHQRVRGFTVWKEEDFPRTHTLKVKKNLLTEILLNDAEATSDLPARQPAISEEVTLEQLVAEIAEMPVAQITADKTLDGDLDMDSLKRVELLSAIEEQFGVYLDESVIERGTTIDYLARMVDQGPRSVEQRKFVRWGMSWWCRPLRGAIQRAAIFPVLRLLYKFSVVGASEIEGMKGPILFAANHCLRLDNGLLIKAMPLRHRRRLAIAAWEELWRNPAYRITHPLIGNGFPFSKEGAVRASLDNMGRILDDGWSVLIYPEGELTVGGPMQSFRGGTGLVAVESGIPVVPVKLDILKLGSPSDFPVLGRGEVEVRFGSPITFSRATSYEDATDRIEQAVRSL
ncbi:MAG: AMP-binding protein [Chloroflexi bacterium]|nr:AMP-binding protein [Chloroflexota bacterium]